MTVSVVIPCYNGARFIAEAIDSVISQTWSEIEIIVVDDGSLDGSAELVRSRFGPAVTVLSQSNKGAAAARNAGARIASGKYLLFLDADDTIGPRFLEGLVEAGEAIGADMTLGTFVRAWPDGRAIEHVPKFIGQDRETMIAALLTDGWVAVHAILWRAGFLRKLGGWNDTLSFNDDGELVFRAILAGPRIATSSIDRAVYLQHDGDRISGWVSRAALTSQHAVLQSIIDALGDRIHTPVLQRALSRSAYDQARKFYEHGCDDLAARCESLWRGLGRPYVRSGSIANRWGSAILGLKNKAVLARTLRQLRAADFGRNASG